MIGTEDLEYTEEGIVDKENDTNDWFETLPSLLFRKSPQFQKQFHFELFSKLEQLQHEKEE